LKAREVDANQAPPAPECNAALRDDYVKLHEEFRAKGWLDPTTRPLFMNLARSAFFFSLALFCPWDSSGRLPPTLFGIFLGMAFHQLAFTVHDTMHGEVVFKKGTARAIGYFLGNLLFGVLSDHWDDEHMAHHVMSNCVDYDLQQRNAPLITVDRKQLTEKRDRLKMAANVEQWLLRVNHWFWLLAATWGGRIALQVVSCQWVSEKPRLRLWQIPTLLFHYAWLVTLVRTRSAPWPVVGGVALGPWFAGLTTYLVAGILHVQLLMNHASRPMHCEKDSMRSSIGVDWISWQTSATADVRTPRWGDWFFGGLQFQIAHHLFPRLQADRLRDASVEVYALLKRHKEPVHVYDGFFGGVAATTRQLATACKEAGHKPWFVGASSLHFPNIFWLLVHVFLLILLPLSGVSDGWYVATWAGCFGVFLTVLFSPLVGLA